MGQHFNREVTTELRKRLRNDLSPIEWRLWYRLKNKQLGQKFRRQYGVGPYVIDFYCPELNLAIEIDGESHYIDGEEKDAIRQQYIEKYGIKFLRFTNNEVVENVDGVIEVIFKAIKESPIYFLSSPSEGKERCC